MQAARGENDRTKLVITSSSETDHDHEHVSLVGNLTSPDSGRSNGRHDDGHGAHENRHGSDERPVPKPSQRRLGFFAVAVVLFASVAGGPYGIEAAVGSAGALPVLVGSVVLAIMWSAPQALVSAELSTAFPSNGGYITWVVEGLGPVLGFINAANGLAAAVTNLPLYPVLFVSTLQQLAPNISEGTLIGIKMGFIAATVVVNLIGITSVSRLATLFTVLVQVPFIVMPIAAAVMGCTFDWSAVASVQSDWSSQFSLFISTLCWNAIGWSAVGNIASEVRNPKRSYPIGAGLATVMVCVNYLYPVALCVAMAPNINAWTTGYFADIGRSLSPAFGIMATVGCAFSALNNFQPQLSTTARALRFAGLYRMLPLPLLHRNLKRFGTPAPAIFLEAIIVAILCQYGFNVLVTINVLFYNCGLALQFAAFLRMRYTRPHLTRPYEVPGGKWGAWTVTVLLLIILGIGVFAAVQTAWWAIVVAAGANVLFLVAGLAWARWGYKAGLIETIDVVEARGLDAGDPANAQAVVEAAAAVAAAAAAGHEGTAAVLAFLEPGGAGGAAVLDASVARSTRSSMHSMHSTSGHAYGDLTDGETDDDEDAAGKDVETGAVPSGKGRGRAANRAAGAGASGSLNDSTAPASPSGEPSSVRSNLSIKLPRPAGAAASGASGAVAGAAPSASGAAVMSSSAGSGSGLGIGGLLAGLLGGRPAAPTRGSSSTSMTLASASHNHHPAHPNCTHSGAGGAGNGLGAHHGSHGGQGRSSFSSRGVTSPHHNPHSSATSPRMPAHPSFSGAAGSLPGSTYGVSIPGGHGGSGAGGGSSAIPFDFTESTPFEEPGLVAEDGTSGGGVLAVEPQGSPPAGIALVELDLNTAEQLTLDSAGYGHEHGRQHSRYGHSDGDDVSRLVAERSAADEDYRGLALRPVAPHASVFASQTRTSAVAAAPAAAAAVPSLAAQGAAPAGAVPSTVAGLVGIGPFRPKDSRNSGGHTLPHPVAGTASSGPASPIVTPRTPGATSRGASGSASSVSAGAEAAPAAGPSPFSLAAALASSGAANAAATARSTSTGTGGSGSAIGGGTPAPGSPAAGPAAATAAASPSSASFGSAGIAIGERHGAMTRSPGQAHLRGLLATGDGNNAGAGAGVGVGSLAVGSFALGSLPGTAPGAGAGLGGMGGIGLPLSMLPSSMMPQPQAAQAPSALSALASAASAAAAAGTSTPGALSPRSTLAVSPVATPPALPSPLAAASQAARQTSSGSGAAPVPLEGSLSPGHRSHHSGGTSIGGLSLGAGSAGAAAGAASATATAATGADAADGSGSSSPPLTSAKAYAAWVAAQGTVGRVAVDGAGTVSPPLTSAEAYAAWLAAHGADGSTFGPNSNVPAEASAAAAAAAASDSSGAVKAGAAGPSGGLSRRSSAGDSAVSKGEAASAPSLSGGSAMPSSAAGTGAAAVAADPVTAASREGSGSSVTSSGGGAGSSSADSRAASGSSAAASAGSAPSAAAAPAGKKPSGRPSSARSQGSAVSAVAVKAAASKANADARVRLLAAEDKDDSDGEGIERYMPKGKGPQ